MNRKEEQRWLDLLSGMQNRASQLVNDGKDNGQNRNWYSSQLYEDKYVKIKNEFQRQKMAELDSETSRSTYTNE